MFNTLFITRYIVADECVCMALCLALFLSSVIFIQRYVSQRYYYQSLFPPSAIATKHLLR